MKIWLFITLVLLWLVSCGPQTAGGTSEETNAIAGVILDESGLPMSKVAVTVRSNIAMATASNLQKSNTTVEITLWSEQVWTDTTDAKGQYRIQPGVAGDYVVLAKDAHGNLSMRQVQLANDLVKVHDTLHPAYALKAQLQARFGTARGSKVYLMGTDRMAEADSAGFFTLDSIPQGEMMLQVQSSDPYRYAETRYVVSVTKASQSVYGPFMSFYLPETLATTATAFTLKNAQEGVVLELPLVYAYEVRAWWAFDALSFDGSTAQFVDSRGRSGNGLAYNSQLSLGIQGKAVKFTGASSFAVIEDPGSVFEEMTEFSTEAWVRIDELPDSVGYQMNLYGKLGWNGVNDMFSMAVDRSRNDSAAHWAFLVATGSEGILDSNGKVLSTESVVLNEWTHLMATWNGTEACVYVNGKRSACRTLEATPVGWAQTPMVFGKEDLTFVLDEVRLIGAKLEEADARYRWLRRFE